MKANWSINVTTRNPNRLKEILKILAEFEGRKFDENQQAKFIDAVVSAGLYKPIKEINDKSLRGRTWAGIFNTLGFAIAYKTYGVVTITPAGKKLIHATDEEESEIFLRQFLKWQLTNPTPTARGFNDYDIIPFIATLHLLKGAGGLSKEEFILFVSTLKRAKDIERQLALIKKFRESVSKVKGRKRKFESIKRFSDNFLKRIYKKELKEEISTVPRPQKPKAMQKFLIKKQNNLKDYGDTIIRYFRYTQFISLKGGKILLADSRKEEIRQILEKFSGSAGSFKDKTKALMLKKFYAYLGSADEPLLPYESRKSFIIIVQDLQDELLKMTKTLKNKSAAITELLKKDPKKLSVNKLKNLIITLRKKKKELIDAIDEKSRRNPEELSRIIDTLEKIDSRDSDVPDKPLWLEWYTFLALKSIDDEELIKPNFPLDENNEPTSVAVPNKPDIEAYYTNCVLVPEVTMSAGRSQYFQEGIPVTRHVSAIKSRESRKVLGIFIAPTIHSDTRNQFLYFSKEGIDGVKVTIIPLTLGQFIKILKILLEIRSKRELKSRDWLSLFDSLDKLRFSSTGAEDWLKKFDETIDKWGEDLE